MLSLLKPPPSAGLLRLPLLGNKYLATKFTYKIDPGAGKRNRAEFARQFGEGGEKLVEALGKGHQPELGEQGPESQLENVDDSKLKVEFNDLISDNQKLATNSARVHQSR